MNMRRFALLFFSLLLVSCAKQDQSFCAGATAKSYEPSFKIWCPTMNKGHFIPTIYGEGVSPPIMWEGLPLGTTHLHITVLDATCTYECDSCCQFHHWELEIPLHELPSSGPIIPGSIQAGASKTIDAKYAQPNGAGKKSYFSFAPPPSQVHAYIYQATAYTMQGGKKRILGRSQSDPLLFRVAQ